MELKQLLLVIAIGVLIAGCTINPQDTAPQKPAGGPVQGQNASTQNPANASAGIYTLAEVAKHDTKEDCWMVIDGKVLDLTSYTSHPGGDTYVPYCGTDGTQGFNDKGGIDRNHSNYAFSLIEDYVIGELGKPMDAAQGSPAGTGNGTDASQPTAPPRENTTAPPADEANAPQNGSSAPTLTLTMAEVAKHNIANDCWMVIYGKVLNLSSFTSHPGGSTYLPYCGSEATEAFDTKGGRGNAHSNAAAADLSAYTIGELGQPQNRTVNAANTTVANGSDEDDWDDEEENGDDD